MDRKHDAAPQSLGTDGSGRNIKNTRQGTCARRPGPQPQHRRLIMGGPAARPQFGFCQTQSQAASRWDLLEMTAQEKVIGLGHHPLPPWDREKARLKRHGGERSKVLAEIERSVLPHCRRGKPRWPLTCRVPGPPRPSTRLIPRQN